MSEEFLQTGWDKVLNKIKESVGESSFKVWFSHFQPKNFHQGVLKIEVPSKFVKNWLEKKFNYLILKSIREIFPEVKTVEFIISTKTTEIYFKKTTISKKFHIIQEQNISLFSVNPTTGLNPRYRFDNFVVGKSNELAFSACQGVVNFFGKTPNPLFIYGPVGVGKTHLLQATGNEILKKYKDFKIKYLTTEEFTNEFINSLKNHTTEEFKRKFREVDVLILDDVHFLSGKTTSQEELFHTFNYLYNLSKQIIFSSDKPPSLISDIEERLRSRFEGGLVIDIQPPDYETRLAILKLKSQERGVVFEDFVYEIISQKITQNIRELEGALSAIIFLYQNNQKITPNKVEEVISKFIKNSYKKVSIKRLIKTIAEHYELKEEDLLKPSRIKHIVQARQYLIYFLREVAKLSYTSIGSLLKKDHTTIIYSYEKVVKIMKKNPQVSQEIEVLKSKILGY